MERDAAGLSIAPLLPKREKMGFKCPFGAVFSRDAGDHEREDVAAERVHEEFGQRRVAVGHVPLALHLLDLSSVA